MDKHYKEKLSAYINHELPNDERQEIAGHLLLCADCRKEHDEIKLGAALASKLERAEAPAHIWEGISAKLDEKQSKTPNLSLIPNFSFFSSRGFLAAAASILIVFGLASAVYFTLFNNAPQQIVENTPQNPDSTQFPDSNINADIPEFATISDANSANQNSNLNAVPNINGNLNSNISPPSVNINSNAQAPQKAVSNPQPQQKPNEAAIAAAWNIERIAGSPKSGDQVVGDKGVLEVGKFLETDSASRARIAVANIGNVEIAPNSRVKLVRTNEKEHRLSLERGLLQAKIDAPPRLFIVDTPSAAAVDLGCEYTLEVDKAGNSKLHVTSGFVSLERNGRESMVPAGAFCFTKKGKGLGTPYFDDAPPEFQAALAKFDFENGGSKALDTILREPRSYDTLTLWHLLPKTQKTDRERVFDALSGYVRLPAGATKEGILQLDKKMLALWRKDIETLWFE